MDHDDSINSSNDPKGKAFIKYNKMPIPSYHFLPLNYYPANYTGKNLESIAEILLENSTQFVNNVIPKLSLINGMPFQNNKAAIERIGNKNKHKTWNVYREPKKDYCMMDDTEDNNILLKHNSILKKVQNAKINGNYQTSRIVKSGHPSRYQIMDRPYKPLQIKPLITCGSSNTNNLSKFVHKKRNKSDLFASILKKWTEGHQEERMHISKMGKSTTSELIQMIQDGLSIVVTDEARRTALHVACSVGNLEAVELLLKLGADPNAIDIRGNTPLTLAAMSGYTEIVLLLLQHGADPKSGSDRLSPSAMIRLRIKQLRAQIKRNRTNTLQFSRKTGEKQSHKFRAVRQKAFMVSQECMSILKILQYYTANDRLKNLKAKKNTFYNREAFGGNDSDDYITDIESDNNTDLVSTSIRDAFVDLSAHLQNLSFKENQIQTVSNLDVGDDSGDIRINSKITTLASNLSTESFISSTRLTEDMNVKTEQMCKSTFDDFSNPETKIYNGDSSNSSQFSLADPETLKSGNSLSELSSYTVEDEDTDSREIENVLDKLGSLVDQLNLN
ncbi:hypothetical protein BB561_004773 [Smittium simulii]|uniref:Uncharacterized protein n=1 Tax=Smittium simulii TaxID=133385 RepID=A0A2T9YEE6_9FUNG|nr:hypothetical protein BB561_004773 [Smittium simulii]